MATLLMVESWLQSTGLSLPLIIRDLGHDYVLMTRDPGLYARSLRGCGAPHPALGYAAGVVVAETNDPAAAARVAGELAGERRIDGVLTTCDYYLAAAATVAARLGLPGPRPETLRAAVRKDLVRAALDVAGVPNPHHAVAATWDEAVAAASSIGYPLVAKPVDLNAGTSVRLVGGETDLKDAVNDIVAPERNTRGQPLQRLVLMEERLTGVEVSVEAVTVGGRTTVMGMTDKSVTGPPAFVESGHMFPARMAPAVAGEVEAFVLDVLRALGLTHGLTHTEVMVTDEGPRLVEINPRQGGGLIFDLVQLVTGTNPLELLVELALGDAPVVGTAARPLGSAVTPRGSASVVFVMAPHAGVVEGVTGLERLTSDPHVLRWTLPTPVRAAAPLDNEAYLGHVVAVDPVGDQARRHAEQAVGRLELHFADGRTAPPLGIPSGLA